MTEAQDTKAQDTNEEADTELLRKQKINTIRKKLKRHIRRCRNKSSCRLCTRLKIIVEQKSKNEITEAAFQLVNLNPLRMSDPTPLRMSCP